MKDKDFDVVIVGGSYAGLSAAMALGRSLRRVLVIDSGSPCNRQTPHSHNFITQDGETPHAIASKARQQVSQYSTIKFVNDIAVNGEKTENGFRIKTQGGANFSGNKLLFATGIKDTMPNIKGFEACWGISVVHCPYCHGYELRGMKTGILANAEKAFHLASLVSNLTDDVTVLTSGRAQFNSDQTFKLNRHHIPVVESEVSEIEHNDGHARSVVFTDGTRMDFNALYAAIPFTQHSTIPVELGCEVTENGYIKIDSAQKTNIPGVFACGDNSNMMRSVANAVYSGNVAGAMINRELTEERF